MNDSSRPRELVYVAGYGRSGSTLLDAVLGNHPQVFGAGELTWLFRYTLHGEGCSCGSSLAACPFWQSVLSRVFAACPGLDCARAARLTLHVEWRKGNRSQRETYLRLWETTLKAILDVSGRRLIVDSTKSGRVSAYRLPLFGRHLKMPVKVLHLVRDPRAVMWSVRRGSNRLLEKNRQRKPTGAMARGLLGWILANAAVERLCRGKPSVQASRLRYEDLASDPTEIFARIDRFLGIDTRDIVGRLERGDAFSAGHGVAGNRMRRQSRIVLRFDREWQRQLPNSARWFSIIAWPLIRRYGYPLTGTRRDCEEVCT